MKRQNSRIVREAKKSYRWLRRKAYRAWVAQIKTVETAMGGEIHACGADVIFRGACQS